MEVVGGVRRSVRGVVGVSGEVSGLDGRPDD